MNTIPDQKTKKTLTSIQKRIEGELRFAYSAIETQIAELESDALTAQDNLRELVEAAPEVRKQLTALEESTRRQRQRLLGVRKSLHLILRKRRHFLEGLGIDPIHGTTFGSSQIETSQPAPDEAPPAQRSADHIRHSRVESLVDIFRSLLMLPKRGVR